MTTETKHSREEITGKLDIMRDELKEFLTKHNGFFKDNKECCAAATAAMVAALTDNSSVFGADKTASFGDPIIACKAIADKCQAEIVEEAQKRNILHVVRTAMMKNLTELIAQYRIGEKDNRAVCQFFVEALMVALHQTAVAANGGDDGQALADVIETLIDVIQQTKDITQQELERRENVNFSPGSRTLN